MALKISMCRRFISLELPALATSRGRALVTLGLPEKLSEQACPQPQLIALGYGIVKKEHWTRLLPYLKMSPCVQTRIRLKAKIKTMRQGVDRDVDTISQ